MIFYGIYNKTIFRNEENGYTIFAISTKELDEYKSNGIITCSGIIPVYAKGMPLKLDGEISEINNEFRFIVKDVTESSNEKSSSVSFLSSPLFPHIGESTAKKIIEITGADIFSFIENTANAKDLISSNVKIKDDILDKLIKTIKSTSMQKKIYDYLGFFGGDYSNAADLYELFGINAINELKLNPYDVGRKIGLSFYTCDSIAKDNNIYIFNTQRINAIIYKSINMTINNGNVYCNLDDIIKNSKFISKNSAYGSEIPDVLLATAINNLKNIIIEKGHPSRIYFKSYWDMENKISSNLYRISNAKQPLNFSINSIKQIEEANNITYSETQKNAFNFLSSTGIKILTGGPGTGKTTIIRGLIQSYKKMYPQNIITLCAPTGRAAQRMSESTGEPASTIHKLLDFKPFGNEFIHKTQIDPLDSDFLIVDEASMIDMNTFEMLLSALKSNILIVLCGDVNQLPSVGCGNILTDLIKSNKFEVNRLSTVYRQALDSLIISNAYKINNGKHDLKTGKDFEIITVKTENDVKEQVLLQMKKYFNATDKCYAQVLSPVKRGVAGINNLNKELQSILNPDNMEEAAYGKTSFRINDKIIFNANNYKDNYLNGDIGVITSISEGQIEVQTESNTILVTNNNLKDLSLAYAITIHKSQGSEFPITIISLPENPCNMLQRRLLYTAVTRAKNKVIIITQNSSLHIAIDKNTSNVRKTSLLSRLIEIFSPL